MIKILTDGSFKKLKNKKILCGYGIYFPNGELENVARPFIHEPLTNQRVELYAILKALRNIEKNKVQFDTIMIYTDSEYSIKSVTEWYKSWEKNNWKNAKGQAVMNQDIIRPLIKILKSNSGKIKFQNVN